jgi:hypothetical protein
MGHPRSGWAFYVWATRLWSWLSVGGWDTAHVIAVIRYAGKAACAVNYSAAGLTTFGCCAYLTQHFSLRPAAQSSQMSEAANLPKVRGRQSSFTRLILPIPIRGPIGIRDRPTSMRPVSCAVHGLNANRHWRITMPNKDASEKEKESGARRTASKEKAHPLVPTNESTKEAGPRRLYAAPNSSTSTSTKESGTRRIYTSGSGSSGNMGTKPQR